jgi:tRNA nucleotidyltransferase (CCA-adding enzyme)
MEVITTHLNADFDAFASMVAAKKLYPNAVVSFPGSQEKNVRDFFMESTMYILSIERARGIDLNAVRRLILVDTRQKSRIGRFASLADKEGIEIHVFDHHPDSDDDVRGSLQITEEVGATVTILIREIRRRGIDLTPEEATVLALGLYEDTGAFTFSSTTAQDMAAAAWLLEKGANVKIVSDMMTTDLNKDQIELLHQLIQEAETINIGGLEIALTMASVTGYVPDAALMVHKFRDMENLDAVFALLRMDSRVHLVARSRLEEVNAGEIAGEFGGGGHPTAASATIKELTLYEAREALVRFIHERVRPKKEAAHIMSHPPIIIAPDRSLAEAAESLSRYQITSLPVVRADGQIVGILHRHSVEKACHHGLEESPVAHFMDSDVVSVAADDPIDKVTRISVEGRHRLVPVITDGKLVGVISRSDLLEHMKLPLAKDAPTPDQAVSGRMRIKNVGKAMQDHFPDRVLETLRIAGDVASGLGKEVYLVGGAVRDLFLRIHNLDIDLVVDAEGISFAKEFAQRFKGCRIRGHDKFGTAVLFFEDGFRIDVATARQEYYARPGALPTVEAGSIKRDLFRRDFTMNTLAVSLNLETFGRVIDFFGGARDIKERVIRVMHNLAFVEDPTRMLRAVRFSCRFGFTIAKHTASLMKRAVKMRIFDRVEGIRLRHELEHILDEKNPEPPLKLMADLDMLAAIHESLKPPPRFSETIDAASGVLSWWRYLYVKDRIQPWIVYFLALTDSLDEREFDDVLRRFSFAPGIARCLGRDRLSALRMLPLFARGDMDAASKVVEALNGLPMEMLLMMMAKTTREETRRSISEYITGLRHIRPYLTGADFLRMGVKPGPEIGKTMRALRAARLDKKVLTEQDEREMARKLLGLEDSTEPEQQPEIMTSR